jgi:Contractile injection system tube protein
MPQQTTSSPDTRPRRVGAPTPQAQGPTTASPFDDPVYALVVINLETGEGLTFTYFPEQLDMQAQATWRAQPVTRGTQPLLYASNEPEKVTFTAWLDRSPQGESVSPDVVKLFFWTKPVDGKATPPALLVSWGDTNFRCVLEEVRATERHFTADGRPMRAEINLSFVELQDDVAPSAPQNNVATASAPPPFSSSIPGAPGSIFGPEP